MPIQAACTSCGHVYSLGDQQAGKQVRCKHCGSVFVVLPVAVAPPKAPTPAPVVVTPVMVTPEVVPAPKVAGSRSSRDEGAREEGVRERPAPTRSRRSDDDDEPARPKRRGSRRDEDDDDDEPTGGSLLWLWITGGVAVVLIAAGATIFFLTRSPSDPVIARNDPPIQQQPPVVQQPVVQPPITQPPVARPAPPPVRPNPVNPPIVPPNQPRPEIPQNPPQNNPPKFDNPLAKPALWKVENDPGIDLDAAIKNMQWTLVVPKTANLSLNPPSTPSPVVALRLPAPGLNVANWQVVDLRDGKAFPKIPLKLELSDTTNPSPDGKYLLGFGKAPDFKSTQINVFDTAQLKYVQSLTLPKAIGEFDGWVDYVADEHFMLARGGFQKSSFDVFSIATGQRVASSETFKTGRELLHVCTFSPGRRYFVITHEDKLSVLKMPRCEVVGTLTMPRNQDNLSGIAFSPDGQELACLWRAPHQIVSWKWATGELQQSHTRTDLESNTTIGTFRNARFNRLQWVPDRSGWLVDYNRVIDAETGDDQAMLSKGESNTGHFFINKNTLLAAQFEFNHPNALAIKKYDIQASQQAIAEERKALELPPTKPADRKQAKALTRQEGTPWKPMLDPQLPSKKLLASGLMPIAHKLDDIDRLLFSRNDVGQAALICPTRPALKNAWKFEVERLELSTGRTLGTSTLFNFLNDRKGPNWNREQPGGGIFSNHPMGKGGARKSPKQQVLCDLSPDGTLIAVCRPAERQRVDIFSIKDGKHQIGFEPLEYDSEIDWLGFVDSGKLLTYVGQKLILWNLAEPKAEYIAEGFRPRGWFSANRKVLAMASERGLSLLDPASGASLGDVNIGDEPIWAAFSPECERLAVYSKVGMVVVDMTSGVEKSRQEMATTPNQFNWAGPSYLATFNSESMSGVMNLFHIQLGQNTIFYSAPSSGKLLANSPDQRTWYLANRKGVNMLIAAPIPDAVALQLGTLIDSGQVKPAIADGSPVELNVQGEEPFATSVKNTLTDRIGKRGLVLGPGGITITVVGREIRTGKEVTWEIAKDRRPGMPFGPLFGPRDLVKINEVAVECEFQVADAKGQVLTKNSHRFLMPSSMTFTSENYEQELAQAAWRNAPGVASMVPLGRDILRLPSGEILQLPRPATLP